MASNASEKSRIYGLCVRLLSRREYGQASLRRKLQTKGYSSLLCDEVLADLAASGLQSDARCAEAILRTGDRRGWSRRRSRARMIKEGLSEEIIAAAPWPEAEEEQAVARALYNKWLGDERGDTKKRQRVLQRLARRGFSIGFLFNEDDPTSGR